LNQFPLPPALGVLCWESLTPARVEKAPPRERDRGSQAKHISNLSYVDFT
jgi:hypothetical protein